MLKEVTYIKTQDVSELFLIHLNTLKKNWLKTKQKTAKDENPDMVYGPCQCLKGSKDRKDSEDMTS